MDTQPATQPLRGDQNYRRRDVERRDTHVEHPRKRGGGVVRVQRGQDEVARLRRLDRDVGGLEVADLADHDDVGILAQERLERHGEGEARLVVDVDLVHAGQLDFARIFGGRNVHTRLVQDVEARVQRDGLSASLTTRATEQYICP